MLGHTKRMDLVYFKFPLFPITAEWSEEGKEACTYEMIWLVPAGIFENSS